MISKTTSFHREWKQGSRQFTKISLGAVHQNDAMLIGMQTGKGRPTRRGSAIPALTCKPGMFTTAAR